MSSYTLDDIRSAADRKFGSTDIQVGDVTCRLINPLRLPKDRRDALVETQKRLDNEDADQERVLRDAIRVVCENDHQADVLLAAVGEDLGVLATLFEKYTTSTEAGEASASAA